MKYLYSLLLLIISANLQAQTVDVTFRYYPSDDAVRAFVPGEFNNWGNNNSGQISPTDGSLMEEDVNNGFWYKTISLEIGGGTNTYNGESGYTYKFHEHLNETGSSYTWLSDPLNEITVGQNNDSFLKVTSPLIFQMQPSESSLADENSEIWATVAAQDTDPIDVNASSFYLNGNLEGSFAGRYETARQLFSITDLTSVNLQVGVNKLMLEAVTESGATVRDSVEFSYLPDVQPVKQARPAGLEDGITYNNGVHLSLFAPDKDYVFVIGDFNDWTPSDAYLMKKDSLKPDSVWHWIQLDGLTNGQEYAFQYLVEGELKIADPYSDLVLDPYNDPYIDEATFPNLKPYPEGKTTGYVSLLQPGKTPFNWTATNYVRPEKDELVIYELLLRDFLETSNYQTLTDSLDYLEKLGVNAIELMPVNEFDGNLSWGYNPSFHYALDKAYGTPEAFKTFVDEAHKRNIAVILDVVLNHATGSNPLYQLYDTGNPYFNTIATHAYNVFNDFDHSYSGTQYYTQRVIEHWINEYKVDGFRWDLTKGFTQNCTNSESCTGSYQQDRVDILKHYADLQWQADPNFIVIFEHLGTETEEAEWANYRIEEGKGVLLWGNMNHNYNEASMGYVENGNSDLSRVLASSRSSFQGRSVVGYMESHDEQWMMFKNRNFGNVGPGYDVRKLGYSLGRQKLAGVFFFTLPGPKMMWQFGEVGYGGGPGECLKPGNGTSGDCEPTDPGRVDAKPIRWDYYNESVPGTEEGERLKLFKTWQSLIQLRKSSPVFTQPEAATYNLRDSVKSIILEHTDSDVLILGNFDVEPATANFNFTTTGTWYDYFAGTSMDVTELNQSMELQPGEFKIYTTRSFASPEEGLPTSNEGDDGIPKGFSLEQNYPNPFNPTTTIRYELANAGWVRLQVYDVLGRQVAELVDEQKAAGSYTVNFDASGLGSGMYIYRMQANGKVFTQKMTLIK